MACNLNMSLYEQLNLSFYAHISQDVALVQGKKLKGVNVLLVFIYELSLRRVQVHLSCGYLNSSLCPLRLHKECLKQISCLK